MAITAALTAYTAPAAVATPETAPPSVRISVTSACFTHRFSWSSRVCFITSW